MIEALPTKSTETANQPTNHNRTVSIPPNMRDPPMTGSLFKLFLGAKLIGVTTLLFAAIGGTRRQTRIAFSANGLVAIESLGKKGKRRIVDSSTQTKDQMQGRLLLNVVVRQSSSIFQLLSSKNQSLLIRGNSFLVLNLGLDIVNRITGLDIERDGLSRQGLDKDLHLDLVWLGNVSFGLMTELSLSIHRLT
jgi:hypothetical protein